MLIAITRAPAAWSAAVADASVAPFDGSWPGASPNQTTIRDEPLRKPVAGFDESSWSAKSCDSGSSPPPDASHWLMPVCASAVLAVIAVLRR